MCETFAVYVKVINASIARLASVARITISGSRIYPLWIHRRRCWRAASIYRLRRRRRRCWRRRLPILWSSIVDV
jgi:hypothetical protein